MKLTNEFTVAVPLERAWDTLLDIERVAGFLPGAKIEPATADGVLPGTMRVKVGPMVVNYRGTARLVGVDTALHTADIAVEAKDTKGQGTAAATIHNKLITAENGTRVVAETDLSITGRQAQFGRGVMQDIAGRMLDDFAHRFEQYLLETEAAPPAEPVPPQPAAAEQTPSAAPADTPDALDLGSVLFRTPSVQRAGLMALGFLMAILLLRRRRRRS